MGKQKDVKYTLYKISHIPFYLLTPTYLLILSANPNSEGIGRPGNPGRISADHERQLIFICLNKGKHANVLSSFSLKGSHTGFRSDRLQTATAVCLVESRMLYVNQWE